MKDQEAPTMMPLPVELSPRDYGSFVDPWMVASTFLLLSVGIVCVYSGSALIAEHRFGGHTFFLLRHLSSVGLGLVVLVAALRTPLERWSLLAYPFLLLTFVLLGLTLFGPFAQTYNGASRWLSVGPIRFQPAELSKLAVPIYLAHSLAAKREKAALFSVGFLPHALVVSAMVALVLKQPDLGTSVVLYATLAAVLFVAGTRTAYLVLAVLAALPVLGLYLARYPHAWRRIEVFLAGADPHGAGYHVAQSLVAFGSGGVWGMGLGEGTQKLFFLPEPHTDFIFATIGQELGFVGACSVLAAFAVLIFRSMWFAAHLPCRFPMYLTFGLAASICMQVCINTGVATALLPAKGLTLPLLSFGRSSMVVGLLMVGILLRASAEYRVLGRAR